MDIRTREAVRYLGYGKHAIDERTSDLIQSSFDELGQVADVKFIYRIFEISELDTNELMIGTLKVQSEKLYRNLHGCHAAVLFCATLGTSVDLLMKRYAVIDMAKATVLQACAAALLEEYCDNIQEQIAKGLSEGEYLRPRFSPGYGDFSILHQRDLLQLLDASKKIGLSMTDGYMLTPMKSITAVIGISHECTDCHMSECDACSKIDCVYRRSE